jgi:hypothetical protein
MEVLCRRCNVHGAPDSGNGPEMPVPFNRKKGPTRLPLTRETKARPVALDTGFRSRIGRVACCGPRLAWMATDCLLLRFPRDPLRVNPPYLRDKSLRMLQRARCQRDDCRKKAREADDFPKYSSGLNLTLIGAKEWGSKPSHISKRKPSHGRRRTFIRASYKSGRLCQLKKQGRRAQKPDWPAVLPNIRFATVLAKTPRHAMLASLSKFPVPAPPLVRFSVVSRSFPRERLTSSGKSLNCSPTPYLVFMGPLEYNI